MSEKDNHPAATHKAFPYFFTTDTSGTPIEGLWLKETPSTPSVETQYKYAYDLAIYYDSLGGNDFVDCRCSRWDVQNYNVVIETWVKEAQLQLIKNNTIPGAVGQFTDILGRPRYYDQTWNAFGNGNTLRLLPTPSSSKMNTSNLRNMRQETLIFPKNITTHPIVGSKGWINIKIEGAISGNSDL